MMNHSQNNNIIPDHVQVSCFKSGLPQKYISGPRSASPGHIHHGVASVPVWWTVSAPPGDRTSAALPMCPKGRPNAVIETDVAQGRLIECGMTDASHW